MTPVIILLHVEQMPKRTPQTDFEKRLRKWQKAKRFYAKQAADFLGVKITTYRHWLYNGKTPGESKCRSCIEAMLGNDGF